MNFALQLAGLSFLNLVQHLKIGKQIFIDGPEKHINKLDTPIMDGIPPKLPAVAIAVVLNRVSLLGRLVAGRSALVGATIVRIDQRCTGADMRVVEA